MREDESGHPRGCAEFGRMLASLRLDRDLSQEELDLLGQGGQDGEHGPGDVSLRSAVVAGGAAGRGGRAGVQDSWFGAAAVAGAGRMRGWAGSGRRQWEMAAVGSVHHD